MFRCFAVTRSPRKLLPTLGGDGDGEGEREGGARSRGKKTFCLSPSPPPGRPQAPPLSPSPSCVPPFFAAAALKKKKARALFR